MIIRAEHKYAIAWRKFDLISAISHHSVNAEQRKVPIRNLATVSWNNVSGGLREGNGSAAAGFAGVGGLNPLWHVVFW